MGDILSFITTYQSYFILGLSVLVLILLISNMALARGLAKANKRREAKLAEGRVEDIVDCLNDHSNQLMAVSAQCNRLEGKQMEIADALGTCLRNAGIVRFNAFDDVGGEQSFALAVVDSNKNGVIVSNLYGRTGSRFYAKLLTNGETDRELSDEERKALDIAMAGIDVNNRSISSV